ncbi:VOC family protein [Pseudosulfitobacter koreensis]|uniref:VOC family protein n=1 Tax=Pseudosulfitobacter koreensis TaxID=2968472 RepID=A0ABT1Z0P6_9RHOB|nr:VOC family protein [Pseudosulfitobacter koreense]MCR8826693.1 VOC family protein [Pseudosulfitobacter koreense]
MFTHVMVGANDLERLVTFYDAVLQHTDFCRTTSLDDLGPAGIIWQVPGSRWPQFAIGPPQNGQAASAGNGVMVSFACRSQAAVGAAWKAALAQGGTDAGAPGERPVYSDDFHAAYVRDPEGNKLCFLHCAAFAPDTSDT